MKWMGKERRREERKRERESTVCERKDQDFPLSLYFSPLCLLELEGDSVRDGLLSSGTVSALCSARMTPVSLSPSHINPQQRERERGAVNSNHKTASLTAFYSCSRPVFEFWDAFHSLKGNKLDHEMENKRASWTNNEKRTRCSVTLHTKTTCDLSGRSYFRCWRNNNMDTFFFSVLLFCFSWFVLYSQFQREIFNARACSGLRFKSWFRALETVIGKTISPQSILEIFYDSMCWRRSCETIKSSRTAKVTDLVVRLNDIWEDGVPPTLQQFVCFDMTSQVYEEIVFQVWCGRTWPSTPSNTFKLNWNADCEPDLITRRQCQTSLMHLRLNGNKLLQPGPWMCVWI